MEEITSHHDAYSKILKAVQNWNVYAEEVIKNHQYAVLYVNLASVYNET